ncbi:hypothetical protein L1987_51019 [Smallanthus sonchifolius]|uniref:Uncharacterized protein n=1 Tax=Smallanthus sonchifolius TaxID=185202 RepID=A0ACB9EP62_9ASTR|nr:hypothetical protein L1987_51019 [Smallanthus sonchifolius]
MHHSTVTVYVVGIKEDNFRPVAASLTEDPVVLQNPSMIILNDGSCSSKELGIIQHNFSFSFLSFSKMHALLSHQR